MAASAKNQLRETLRDAMTPEARTALRRTPGRKPVDMGLSGRDAVWAAIRRLKHFTVGQLETATRVPQGTIRTYLHGLTAAGYLAATGRCRAADSRGSVVYQPGTWSLLRDVGVDAPRLTRTGQTVTQGLPRQRIWTAIRGIKEFDYRDLVATASTADLPLANSDVRSYLKHLWAAGYLALALPSRPGMNPARYRLIPLRNTGPKAPQVQRIKQVWDPNLGKVMKRESAREVRS